MDNTEVNVPLLRKAVEWAEAEAAKPYELCEWRQVFWVTPATDDDREGWGRYATTDGLTVDVGRAPECGTCYCIAGYVVAAQVGPVEDVESAALELLGLTPRQGCRLFNATNSIEDVRRIAEEIAGEPL